MGGVNRLKITLSDFAGCPDHRLVKGLPTRSRPPKN